MIKRDASGDWIGQASARHGRALVGYATHLLAGDVHRARDLVQEAFARLCEVTPGEVELPQWLFAVTRNLAIDVLRRERRMIRLAEPGLDRVSPSTSAPDADVRDESNAALRHLATLPARQQEAIRLKFQHDMTYQQIATVMQTTVNNVGVLIHTGLKTLREKMN